MNNHNNNCSDPNTDTYASSYDDFSIRDWSILPPPTCPLKLGREFMNSVIMAGDRAL